MRIETQSVQAPRSRPRQLLVAVSGIVVLLMGSVATTAAADDQVSAVDLVFARAEVGELVELAQFDVDPDLVGRACILSATVFNQISVNRGNDVTISTGDTEIVLNDVEAERDFVTSASTAVVVGDVVVFTLRMGPARVFSGGLSISLDCEPTPTTSTTAPSSTAAPTSTAAITEAVTTTTTTSTLPTGVLDEIVASQPAMPNPGQPTFTG